MANNSSAGVYVRELDLSERVRAASTSIGAIVGASARGPINQRVLCTSTKELLEKFGKPNARISYLHYSGLAFLGESSRLYVTRVDTGALTAGAYLSVDDVNAVNPIIKITNFDDGTRKPKGKYDPFNTLGFDPQQAGIENVLGFFCCENPGEWNNSISVKVRPYTKLGVTEPEDPYLFYVEVYEDYKSSRQPPSESFLVSRDYRLDGYGRQMNIEEVINNRSSIIRFRANPYAVEKIKIVREAFEFLDGADNGAAPTSGQLMRGWDLYRDVEAVDVNILINGGYTQPEVQVHMDEIASHRMDAIAVLDMPFDQQETSRAVYYRRNDLNLDSSYSAIYSPDVKIYDQYNDIELYVPPSGYAAAAYARTDYEAETWFAPAGTSRGDLKIRGVRHVYNLGHRNALTDNQINAIRVFPKMGFKIWGADTLQSKASALSNVNVRRLLNFVEKSLSIAALYPLFDPNDKVQRAQITEMVERFLKPIKSGRGLYYFKVICNEDNNPPEVVANGDLMVDVYLDPVIPAKRINLNAILNKTGSRFTTSSSNA